MIKTKKQFALLALFLSFSTSVFTESFDIGGMLVKIPPPDGYVRVTKDMNAVHRLSMQMSDTMNDLLAYYISESDVPVAMQGGIPPLERTFVFKANKTLKGMIIGSDDFSEIKNMTKRENKQIFNSVQSQLPDYIDKLSKGVGNEFGVDLAMKVSQMVPLDPHYETDNAIAYSMYINYEVGAEGNSDKLIVSGTTTILNTSGKVLFLYCYAPKDDMEWTRIASEAWAEAILTSNILPPTQTSGNRRINWNRVIKKGIAGAIIGGIIALVLGFIKRRKKRG